ncbi:DUF4870 domain-containing protein [Aeribacillus alveayuensis]|uniref:DUF4870 domain-containing protein n=1 Tax=Aeribacillus alveayuensis TaxID=279215 RepID=UPI0005CD10E5|nr:DUF4870 domain-containing protein [Bacillus alveayuensis]
MLLYYTIAFLLPIIVFFISDSDCVKRHAKCSLFSHIIPVISVVVSVLIGITVLWSSALDFLVFGLIAFVGLINIIVVIWNIVQGVKLIVAE